MTDEAEPLYMNCKACLESGEKPTGIEAVIFDGDLMIICKNHDHGLLHAQPYVGPEVQCEACAKGEHDHGLNGEPPVGKQPH